MKEVQEILRKDASELGIHFGKHTVIAAHSQTSKINAADKNTKDSTTFIYTL